MNNNYENQYFIHYLEEEKNKRNRLDNLENKYFSHYLKSITNKGNKLYKLWIYGLNLSLIFFCIFFYTIFNLNIINIDYYTIDYIILYTIIITYYIYIGSIINNIKQYLHITNATYKVLNEFCKKKELYDFYLKEYRIYKYESFKPLSNKRIITLQYLRHIPIAISILIGIYKIILKYIF